MAAVWHYASCYAHLGTVTPLCYMHVCAFVTPCLQPIYICAYAYVAHFLLEDTCKLLKESLYHASTNLQRGSTQCLQEDARLDDAWEASPTPAHAM